MRITGGRHSGRSLISPGARVRPTSETVRRAWIAEIEPQLERARVLDLCAGSGALGLEALSRGAASADFVENGAPSLHALKANLAALRVSRCTRLFKRDAIPFVESLQAGAYDVAFADPPYHSAKLERIVARWLEVPFARILSYEHHRDHILGVRGRVLKFGETRVTILMAKGGA